MAKPVQLLLEGHAMGTKPHGTAGCLCIDRRPRGWTEGDTRWLGSSPRAAGCAFSSLIAP